MSIAADNERKRAGLRRRAGRALAWWLQELRGLYDEAARRLAPANANAIVIEAGERYWILRQRQRPLGQIDRANADARETQHTLRRLVPSRLPLVVEIPQERVLMKRIALPAVAQGELQGILQFEIARHFPFPAERVHFRHRVIGRVGEDATGRGTIEVELVAVPREIVAEICAEIAAAGLRPRGIAIAGAGGQAPLFLPLSVLGRKGAALTRTDRALILALCVLGLAALASPVLHDRARLAAIDREIAVLAPRAQAVLDARERQRREAERTQSPLRLAAARPPVVALLDALTKAVPDGSWLLSLNLAGHELVLDGLSPSAATMALALEQSRVFANVTFRSPITRDPVTGLEHFQLSAAIVEPKP